MKKLNIKIKKDIIKRNNFLKTEFKKLILKSIFQNFKANELVRLDSFKNISFFKKKSWIAKQNNMCLISGRFGGIFKNWQISRHNIKQLAKHNFLTNTKINSW